jgi:hypothetical protein
MLPLLVLPAASTLSVLNKAQGKRMLDAVKATLLQL